MDVLDITEVPQTLRVQKSIFVVGMRAKMFWDRGIDAYPFHQGALLVCGPEDEMRYPTMFLHSVGGKLSITQESPAWFPELWEQHLCGIVEHKPAGFHLPDHARPVCKLPVKW